MASFTVLDTSLVEAVELRDHPFFLGVQFHPEFKSRPNRPHPLFRGFVAAALEPSNAPGTKPNPSPAPNPSRAAQSANAGGILATGPLPVAAETED